MGDLHVAVVDDIGKVVRGEAIAFHDDIVVFGVLLPIPVIDDVVNHGGLLGALEPNGELIPPGGTVIRLFRRDGPACAGVLGRFPMLMGHSLVLL